MSKLGVILALVALGVAGWGASQLCEKDNQIDTLHEANRALQDRLTTIEVKLDEALTPREAATMLTADAREGRAGVSRPAGLTGRAASPIDRLAALEEHVEDQNKRLAKLTEENAAKAKASSAMRRYSPGNFYGNLDMAAKAMALKDNQKSDMEDYLERAQKELADLHKLENDDGLTWDAISKPKMIEGGGFSIAMPDMAKIRKFKKSRIPGSSETFGEAEKRIRKDAFGRMRNVLSPAQTKKWDKANKNAMLRGGRGGMVSAISFVGVGSDD